MLSGSDGGQEEPEEAVHGHAAKEGTCDFLDDAGADPFFSHLGSHRGSKCTSSVTHMTRATAYPHFLTLCSPTGVVQSPYVIPAKISSGCAAVPFHSLFASLVWGPLSETGSHGIRGTQRKWRTNCPISRKETVKM